LRDSVDRFTELKGAHAMADKSTFDRGGTGMTRGGLDRFLAPTAGSYSHLPSSIDDDKINPDQPIEELDCNGKDTGEPVCEIAKAEEEERERGANAT
jgi:hypothetical protein